MTKKDEKMQEEEEMHKEEVWIEKKTKKDENGL